MSKGKTYTGRVYLGRDENGKQQFDWVGRFATKRERDQAVAEAKVRIKRGGGDPLLPTCDEYADRYIADYERRNKDSSADTQRQRLRRFRSDFAGRSLDLPRAEVKDWVNGEGRWSKAGPAPISCVPAVVAMFNYAIDHDDLPIKRNPARNLSRRGKGRGDQPPPTEAEFQKLLDACSVLGKEYAPKMRALILFAAFSLMRPGELYALEWTDIDFRAMRVTKARRLYRGSVAEPKTGRKTIALTPPARDAIMNLSRESAYVFITKTGKRMSQGALSNYWLRVQASAGLDFDFYMATKHYGVHYMWTKLGMSRRAIAAQAGWSLRAIDDLLAVYGHGDVGALDEVDAAFADHRPNLRLVEGGTQS